MTRTSLVGWAALATLATAGVLTACSSPSAPPPPAATAGPPAAPTVDQLRSATVTGVLEQPVVLAEGRFVGAPSSPGGASAPSMTIWTQAVVVADIDGKPGDEAVALLSTNSGGSGEFVTLGVFALRDGKAVSIATAPVGDRVKLERMWVERGEVYMDVVEAGPKEPACCPTQLSRKVFAMEGGALKEKSSKVVGVLSINQLASIDWVLANIDGQPVDQATKPPTLLVQYGKVVGFDGCNRYTGPLKESSPGKISVGPLAATRMACPEPSMQLADRFTARMNKVSGYTFLAGQLALTWDDKKEHGTLVFSK